jgi:hypothetical protein
VIEDDIDRAQYQENSEEQDGDDLMENIEDDYEARPELDRYEQRGLDDQIVQNELSLDGRKAVEE